MTYKEFLHLFDLAKRIATQAHLNQKYGSLPYTVHLEHVQRVLTQFNFVVSEQDFNPAIGEVLVAAWLHDVLEDTVLTKDQLSYQVGGQIVDLVFRVTDEPGKTRHDRKIATYPKIINHYYATVLKLADRIANVESSRELKKMGQPKLFNMYQKEHKEFKHHLYTEIGPFLMWDYLDKLFIEPKVSLK